MSTIDLKRFHRTFFEESFEGLDAMEASLLQLDPQHVDAETLNGIFRAAHSIKGGAGTFGFDAVASYTHLLETLLDEMRAGKRPVTRDDVDLLLRASDVLRGLLIAARDELPVDQAAVEASRVQLQQSLDAGVPQAIVAAAPVDQVTGWQIHFAPKPDLFLSGNDPLRIISELATLGTLETVCNADALPDFGSASIETCYLAWDIVLHAPVPRSVVEMQFAWVEDECDLRIEPLGAQGPVPVPSALTAAATLPVEVPANAAPLSVAASASATSSATATAGSAPSRNDNSGSIRVATGKIDALINLVGELVITQAMLMQQAGALDPVRNEALLQGLSQLDRNTRLLQEAVMSTRMLPVDAVFSRFPRMVRDLAAKLGKEVRLVTVGESTELDKSVIEKISDPLTHLVRNSLDHGLEGPDARRSAGKDVTGTLLLRASHQGGHIVIEVVDDGHGLNRARILAKAAEKGIACSETMSDADVWQLIFAPGFSTAEQVTDVSGRGVGMDVVKKNIQALGGSVELSSQSGRGTTVTIRLPLTLAILDGMTVAVGDDIYILPLSSIIESMQPTPEQIKRVASKNTVVKVRNEYLPLLPLQEWFAVPGALRDTADAILVLVEAEGRKLALQVDDLLGQQQVVIKSLESNYRRVPGVSGATILGDGRVALICDVAEIVRLSAQPAAA